MSYHWLCTHFSELVRPRCFFVLFQLFRPDQAGKESFPFQLMGISKEAPVAPCCTIRNEVTATAPVMAHMMAIWYRTAMTGSVPERIWPVIMPGKATIPVAAMVLMVGLREAL